MFRTITTCAVAVLAAASLAGCDQTHPVAGGHTHHGTAGRTHRGTTGQDRGDDGAATAQASRTLPVRDTRIPVPAGRGDQVARARAELAGLQVKGLAPMTGYQRGCGTDDRTGQKLACSFGPAWQDITYAPAGIRADGCDTRDDVLARDMTHVTYTRYAGGHCEVASGELLEPYSGSTTTFHRGRETSGLVQIDHGRALGDAWRHGASGWSQQLREAYAEDTDHLIAADGTLNEQKGDRTPAAWMPPNKGAWCEYAAAYTDITAKYAKLSGGRFWVGQADKDMLARALGTCTAG